MRHAWGLLLTILLLLSDLPAWADGPNQAGLVVRFADGRVVTRCLSFPEPEITGEEALRRSGLAVVLDHSSAMGAAVCKIEADGCDPARGEECFCKCQGRDCQYWAYFEGKEDGSWFYLDVGVSGHKVRHGSMEGWAWTKGTAEEEAAVTPPRLTFAEVCAPAATATVTLAEAGEEAVLEATPTGTQAGGAPGREVAAFVSLAALLCLAGVAVVLRRRGKA